MDQLEEQVSDLRQFLRQPPPRLPGGTSVGALLSPQPGASPRVNHAADIASQSPSVASPGGPRVGGSSTNKRRPEDDESSPKQQRSKRNRYISLACNECKRRKIKCNGQQPCQRCGHLNLQCLYSPNCCSSSFKESDDYRTMTDQIAKLQEQVNTLFDNMNSLRHDTMNRDAILNPISPSSDPRRTGPGAINGDSRASPGYQSVNNLLAPSVANSASSATDPTLQRQSQPAVSLPSFHGPTSTHYGVNVAKTSMQNMGYTDGTNDNGAVGEDILEMSPPGMMPYAIPPDPLPRKRATDPLWLYDKNEMLRLCRVHEEEVGLMYPVTKIEPVMDHARNLADWMETAKQTDPDAALGQNAGLMDMPTMLLKVIMCCAMVIEGHGHSPKATELFENIRPALDRKLMSDPSEVGNLPLLCLYAGYRFLNSEEIYAWRVMGQVTRLCMELGLHRREGLMKIPDGQDRKNAIITFWTSYVLDRRFSFATGLPFVVERIDPGLPSLDGYPYLIAMVNYSKLGAKIWTLVDYFEPALILELKPEEFETLDQEVLEWYDSLPEELKLPALDVVPLPSSVGYNTQKLQVWTRLRLNQMRIWLHTPVLHSAMNIRKNMQLADKVVTLARETIQFLKKLNDSTNLYRRFQVFYHQFLTSAMAVLFLASAHAPVDFSSLVRTDFYTALELIKNMSAKSWVSQRLWRTVRSLKSFTTKIGLEYNGSSGLANGRQQHGTEKRAGGMLFPGSGMTTLSGMDDYMYSQNGGGGGGNSVESSSYQPSPQIGQSQQVQQSSGASPVGHVPSGLGLQYGQDSGLDDKQNGLALQSEIKNIFEDYFSTNGLQMPSVSEPDYAAASAHSGRGLLTFSSIVGIPPSGYGPGGSGSGGGGSTGGSSGNTNNEVEGATGDGPIGDSGVYLHFKELF